jgi:hypothetical protein
MALHRLSPFMLKQNRDGSMSSICTTCFQTIGKVARKSDLRPLEAAHVCKVTLLSKRMREPQDDENPEMG